MMLNTPRRKKRSNGSQPPMQAHYRVNKRSRSYFKCDKCRKDHKECTVDGESIEVLQPAGRVCDRCTKGNIDLRLHPCNPTQHKNSPYVQNLKKAKGQRANPLHALTDRSPTAPPQSGCSKPLLNAPGHDVHSGQFTALGATTGAASTTIQPAFFPNQGMNLGFGSGESQHLSQFYHQQRHIPNTLQQPGNLSEQLSESFLQDPTMQNNHYEYQNLRDGSNAWRFDSQQQPNDAFGESIPPENQFHNYNSQEYVSQQPSSISQHLHFPIMDPQLLAQKSPETTAQHSKGKGRADRNNGANDSPLNLSSTQTRLRDQTTFASESAESLESTAQRFATIKTKLQNHLAALSGCEDVQSKWKTRGYTHVPDYVFAFVDFLIGYLRDEIERQIQRVLHLATEAKDADNLCQSHYFLLLLDRDVPSTAMSKNTASSLYEELYFLEEQLDSPATAKKNRRRRERYSFPEPHLETPTSSHGRQPSNGFEHSSHHNNEEWNRYDDNNALHKAVLNNDTSSVLEWIETYGMLDEPDRDAETLLEVAARAGHCEMAKILLQRNANVNGLELGFNSPLHAAIDEKHPSMVELLLSQNAKVNMARPSDGKTAYTLGITCENEEIRRLFQRIKQTGWNSAQSVQQNRLIDSTHGQM